MRKVTLLAALLLLTPAVSQAKTLEDLLVEKGVITRGEAAGSTGGGASKVYWNKGTRVDFPDNGFTFGINTFIQTRYTFTDGDEDAGSNNTSSFSVNKARIIVQGTALHEEFSYNVTGDFVGGTAADGSKTATLKDAYLVWHACDWVDLKMGQFKTPISQQFNVSDSALQFADRSIASDYFDLDRQSGLQAKSSIADGLVDVSAGIFNGESDGEGINRNGVDTKHTGTVGVRVNAMGKLDTKEEGDIGNTQDPALSVAAVYAYSDANKADFGGDVTNDSVNAAVTFKFQGWSAQAEYYRQSIDPDVGGDKITPQGYYVQLGYFIDPKTLEIAGRYSNVDGDKGTAPGLSGVDKVSETTVGLNYYWWENHLKAQLNYVHESENPLGGGDNVTTNKWLMQLSAYL